MSTPRKQAKNLKNPAEWSAATRLVRGGVHRSNFGEVSEAIYMNSGFCYDSAETAESRFNGVAPGYVYSRYLNPTLAMLEERLALLEGAEKCCVVASGMAAVFASMMSFLKTGDHVVAGQVLFGSCHYIITQVFPRFGITYELVDATDLQAWQKALSKPTAAVFIESPANPMLTLTDIEAVATLAHKAGAKVIVDNIFATPLYQKPLELGADLVVYSTTKHMDGQGRTLGGAILGAEDFITNTVIPFHRHTGPALSPFNAWVILKGLETLPLRMKQHSENAQELAELLETHPKIARVHYPGLPSFPQYALAKKQMSGFSSLMAIDVKGGKEAAFRLMNHLSIIDISNNLGDAKSLMTHPATTTHSNLSADDRARIGIGDGVLRLSVGLEGAEDLKADLLNALEAV